jgi:phosphotransferase system  glucose/maltose/N-acetylglucosamine-specific IIC component
LRHKIIRVLSLVVFGFSLIILAVCAVVGAYCLAAVIALAWDYFGEWNNSTNSSEILNKAVNPVGVLLICVIVGGTIGLLHENRNVEKKIREDQELQKEEEARQKQADDEWKKEQWFRSPWEK